MRNDSNIVDADYVVLEDDGASEVIRGEPRPQSTWTPHYETPQDWADPYARGMRAVERTDAFWREQWATQARVQAMAEEREPSRPTRRLRVTPVGWVALVLIGAFLLWL